MDKWRSLPPGWLPPSALQLGVRGAGGGSTFLLRSGQLAGCHVWYMPMDTEIISTTSRGGQ